jgi:hypothetical protein
MSVALALEYEAIGKREGNKLGIPESAIDDIVDMLCRTSRHHAIHFRLRPELFCWDQTSQTTNLYWSSLSLPSVISSSLTMSGILGPPNGSASA